VKVVDWTDEQRVKNIVRQENGLTYSAERVLICHCPDCAAVLVVFNDHESWPLVACACGWQGDTLSVDHHTRFEGRGVIEHA
jgi:hypothetical protein